MIFKIDPIYKDYIWGGKRLKSSYGKQSELEKVAESWELSTHPAGVCSLEVDGRIESLKDYISHEGKAVLGSKAGEATEMPILIKLIDASDHLSIQVHPDDDYAKKYEHDLGKTEMWYVLEAEEGAQLVYGFKEDLTKEGFLKSIEEDTLCEQLNYVDVHKGDVFFITPGTMHAIGKGIVIAEVQESSNVTYRVYDYGRKGVDGKPRQLHIKEALEVAHLEKAKENTYPYVMEQVVGGAVGTLASCNYFTVKRIDLEEQMQLSANEESFHHILVVDGEVKLINKEQCLLGHKGESFFVPASTGTYELVGKGQLVVSTL